MKIGIIYFSGTGNTAKFADVISQRLEQKNVEVKLYDITAAKDRTPGLPDEELDAYLFGFPVYALVIPGLTREWISTIKGNSKPCATFFTYGGPTMGIAHYHTKEMLESQGFNVIASAEFLGKHTFNLAKGFELLENRPNKEDFSVAEEFVEKFVEKLNTGKIEKIIFDKPEDYDTTMNRIKDQKKRKSNVLPTRNGKDCSMCGDCEEYCANKAFDHVTGEADPYLCILCLHCITICPDEVLIVNSDLTDLYNKVKDHFKLSEEVLEKRKSVYFI